jgi:hypothetical protein
MTATTAQIALMSPFTVSDSGTFTNAVFTYLSAAAKSILDQDDPGLDATQYDLAHALMICHLYSTQKLGAGGFKSESTGKYSYTKDDAGSSGFLLQYKSIIAGGENAVSDASGELTGQKRNDASMPEMELDQSEVPDYDEDAT